MALVRPQEATFAVVQNSDVWDDAVAAAPVGADGKFEPNTPGLLIPPGQEYQADDALISAPGRLPFDLANHVPDFSIDSLNARYDGALWMFIGLFFGTTTAITLDQPPATPIGGIHTFTMADNVDGKQGTLALDWINAILELDAFKVTSISFTATSGGRLDISISGQGRRWRNDSILNTSTEIAAVTLEGPRHNILFDQLVARINLQSAIALAAGDAICINSFTLNLDRQMDGPVTTCDAPYRDEPAAPAPGWVGTIAFDIPRWDTTDLQDAHLSGAVQKMDLIFTGGIIPDGIAGDEESLVINLPNLTLTGYDFSEQGTIGESITAELGAAAAAPAGMGDINPEFILTNERLLATGVYIT